MGVRAQAGGMSEQHKPKEPKAGQKADWTQEEALDDKDQTTSNRGLQQWGQGVRGASGGRGAASEGTSERAARITSAQLRAAGKEQHTGERPAFEGPAGSGAEDEDTTDEDKA